MIRRYLLLIGSNIDKERNIVRGEEEIGRRLCVLARSAIYESAAIGAPGMPCFFNRAILIECELAPGSLRDVLRGIEADLGRSRGSDRNAPRTIDIDLLLSLDEEDRVQPDLAPDPELATRHHVCIPAAEILPDIEIPGEGTLREIRTRLGPPPRGFHVVLEG